MAEPTQQGGPPLDKTTNTGSTAAKKPGRDPALETRDALMARMDEQIEAERAAEHQRFLESSDVDPRAAALAAAMAKEARGEPLATDRGHRELEVNAEEGEEPETVDGTESVEPVAAKGRPAERVSTKGQDPLGDYVVRVEGKPMFRTVVDGQEKLIPLETARAQLQKNLAADKRLQQAWELKQQLDAREATIRQTEETLRSRSHPAAQATSVDDRKLAGDLVRSLVSEPEDKAAEKMAEAFGRIRQASAPGLDIGAVTKAAREEAQRTFAAEREKEALGNGFTQFTKDYPDIAGNSELFTLADKKSEVIAAEHPEWKPHQIMDEAGRQTRAWMQSMGVTSKVAAAKAVSGNQQRKQNLVPMPQARTAAPAPRAASEDESSPQAQLAEIRKSRGQPY